MIFSRAGKGKKNIARKLPLGYPAEEGQQKSLGIYLAILVFKLLLKMSYLEQSDPHFMLRGGSCTQQKKLSLDKAHT